MNAIKFAATDVIALKPHFRFQRETDAWVLLYPEGMVKLSDSAAEIVRRIDGAASVDAIVAQLQQAFPDTDLRADVFEFLEAAHARGWIVVITKSREARSAPIIQSRAQRAGSPPSPAKRERE